MFNPFTEVVEDGPTDAELVEKAKNGDTWKWLAGEEPIS
jgi:hypothetical protein